MSGICPDIFEYVRKMSQKMIEYDIQNFSCPEFVHVNQTYSGHEKILDASQTNQTEHFPDMKKFRTIFLKMDKLIL